MKLEDFKKKVEEQFNLIYNIDNTSSIKGDDLTTKYLILTGLSVLANDKTNKALTIDELLATLKTETEKEQLLDKLVWQIPGGLKVITKGNSSSVQPVIKPSSTSTAVPGGGISEPELTTPLTTPSTDSRTSTSEASHVSGIESDDTVTSSGDDSDTTIDK